MMWKKYVKRMLALGLSVSMLVSVTACSKEEQMRAEMNPDTPVSEVQFPLKETKELSFITAAPATSTQNPNERVIFQRLEEKTNVHIKWTCFVQDQFSDKKNLALAQFGNLPDGLFNAQMSDYDLLRYAKQGIIIPLENLIDKYMPNLQAVFEAYPEYRTMCTAPDGHIYAFPWIEQLGSGKEAIQAIGDIPYINKKWLDYLGLSVPTTTDELEQVLIAFRDHAQELKDAFDIEGDVIPLSFIINNGDQDPAILINGFGEGYGDTGDHFAVTDEGQVIYTTVQEGYKEGIKWLHKLVEEGLVDPEAFTQEWSTYVAKGKNHRYGLCFTWDISNIDNNTDYVMMPALTGPTGVRNVTRQNNSETSGYDRGRCVLTTSCRDTALAAAWIDQMYAPLQSPQNNWGSYGESDSFNIFEMSTNKDGQPMLKHMDLGDLACIGDKDPGLDSFLCHGIEADRIDGIPFLGKGEIAALVGSADSGSVDGFAVGLHPLTETIEAFPCIYGDPAVRLRADVQGHVSSFCHNVHEQVDQFAGRFIMVAVLIGEVGAQGQTALPGNKKRLLRNTKFRCHVILIGTTDGTVCGEDPGLDLSGFIHNAAQIDVLLFFFCVFVFHCAHFEILLCRIVGAACSGFGCG